MFAPPCCPNPRCRHHRESVGWRFHRRGSSRPRCRRFSIPRFHCLACRRTFSRQSFRADRGDRRPETNVRIFEMLASGVGLRQIARNLHLNAQSVQNKLRKYGPVLGHMHDNLCRQLPEGRTFLLDEEETYEFVGPGEEDYDGPVMKILTTSPIAQSLLNKKVGDKVEIALPRGSMTVEVVKIVDHGD